MRSVESMAETSFTMTFLLMAAVVAMLLGAIGLYGVIGYGVSQRSAEIGLRIALGAVPVQVRRLVLRQGLILAGLGVVAIGLAGAFAVSRIHEAILFQVDSRDPLNLRTGRPRHVRREWRGRLPARAQGSAGQPTAGAAHGVASPKRRLQIESRRSQRLRRTFAAGDAVRRRQGAPVSAPCTLPHAQGIQRVRGWLLRSAPDAAASRSHKLQ